MKLVVGLVAISACATPYQSMGVRGGYAEQRIGPDQWSIRFEGNGHTSRSLAMEYAYRRAGEVCGDGFDVLDADRSSRLVNVNFDYTQPPNYAEKPSAILIIQCRKPVTVSGGVMAGGVDAQPIHPSAAKRSWWCAHSADRQIVSVCNEYSEDCISFRAAMIERGNAMTECAAQSEAVCFTQRRIRLGVTADECAADAEGCEFEIGVAAKDADVSLVAGCHVR